MLRRFFAHDLFYAIGPSSKAFGGVIVLQRIAAVAGDYHIFFGVSAGRDDSVQRYAIRAESTTVGSNWYSTISAIPSVRKYIRYVCRRNSERNFFRLSPAAGYVVQVSLGVRLTLTALCGSLAFNAPPRLS